jgi:HEAT repeat protein
LSSVLTARPQLNLRPWIDRLGDDDPKRRLQAAMVLGSLGPQASIAVPELTGLLEDRYAQVRRVAALALGEIGPEAAAAIPALSRCVTDADEAVRRRAVVALGGIAANDRGTVGVLILALRDDSALVRRCAAAALGERRTAARAAIPALLEALEEDDVKNRVVAAAALARMGPRIVPRLTSSLKHPNAGVRRHVVTILGKLHTRHALTLIRPMLEDPDADVRETATDVLQRATCQP